MVKEPNKTDTTQVKADNANTGATPSPTLLKH